MREALPGYDVAAQRDDEVYAGYVDEWASRCDLAAWKAWTSCLLGGDHPQLNVQHEAALRELGYWLLGRIWPGRHPELERAFTNFRLVLQDLLSTFHEHSELVRSNSNSYTTIRFYKLTWHTEERYRELLKAYRTHIALVQDLVVELTRAANLLCMRCAAQYCQAFGSNKAASWLSLARMCRI